MTSVNLDKPLDELCVSAGPVRSVLNRTRRASPYAANDWSSVVDQVKEAQRSSIQWSQAWRTFCDEEGTGDYDPSRYETAFLQRALKVLNVEEGHGNAVSQQAKYSWNSDHGTGNGDYALESLVEQVKAWQRTDSANGELWRQYCDENGDGTYDPSRHTAAFLKSAMGRLNGQNSRSWLNPQSQTPRRNNQRTRTRGMSLSQLIEEIKHWQRQSLPNSIAWRQFCQENGDGSYDPTRYDSEFLQAAILALYDGHEANDGQGSFVEQVKNWQRSGPVNGDAWREYCDIHGDGNYDPERHDERFLQRALAALSGLSPAIANANRLRPGTLTERVKELQRSHRDAAQRWKEHCESEGDGTYDPSRYEAQFLRTWLDQMHAEGW